MRKPMLGSSLHKVYRFSQLYGLRRAIVKALGRLRVGSITRFVISPLKFFKKNKFVSVIGCGQFTYSTISYFLVKELGDCISASFDIDEVAGTSYSKAFGSISYNSFDKLLNDNFTKIVYIASNHYTHTDYAIKCMERGLDVYVEKPISVNYNQFERLKESFKSSNVKMYVGYNRPFSKAVTRLKQHIGVTPFTLSCTVIGHKIEADHWYRKPEEGTRICGNLGHWIDLAIHLFAARNSPLPESYKISISHAKVNEIDDNICVCISTEIGDLVVLTMTSREEPYEGINETIVFQQNKLFAKIDDFRKAEFQIGSAKFTEQYTPKDVGHSAAIMQPFNSSGRNIEEVFLSTDLMLFITDMVLNRCNESVFITKGKK